MSTRACGTCIKPLVSFFVPSSPTKLRLRENIEVGWHVLKAAGIPTTTPLPLASSWERFTLFPGESSTRTLRSGSLSPAFTNAGRVLWNWAVAVRCVKADATAREGRRLNANMFRVIGKLSIGKRSEWIDYYRLLVLLFVVVLRGWINLIRMDKWRFSWRWATQRVRDATGLPFWLVRSRPSVQGLLPSRDSRLKRHIIHALCYQKLPNCSRTRRRDACYKEGVRWYFPYQDFPRHTRVKTLGRASSRIALTRFLREKCLGNLQKGSFIMPFVWVVYLWMFACSWVQNSNVTAPYPVLCPEGYYGENIRDRTRQLLCAFLCDIISLCETSLSRLRDD